jgi:hypothetical protein
MEYTFHPNPTADFVNFTNPSMVPLTIQLLNLSGEVVSEQKVLDKIDLRFLIEGIYFFKIEKFTYKIVKQ